MPGIQLGLTGLDSAGKPCCCGPGSGSYGPVVISNCACPLPRTIQMTSRDEACNYGMFRSCTLVYGPAPAVMAAFGLRDPMFTSPEMFYDPITKSNFFYYFECYYNQLFLSRIFPTSPISSPFRDGILYAWVIGGPKNTCDPFYMDKGTAFPGSDVTCSISLSGVAPPPPGEAEVAGGFGASGYGEGGFGGDE